ncbi:MAG: hypothetical protein ABSH05_20940 [Bryobacteraceae bacterium]
MRQADHYIIRALPSDPHGVENLIRAVLAANGYERGSASVDFAVSASIDEAYMTALALNHERRMGRPIDRIRSRLHSFSGAARGMLLVVFLHDPEAFIFRPSGEAARNIDELVGLCETHPDEAARHLAAGHFAGWVRMPFHLRCELVVIQHEETDPQAALKRFMDVATSRRKPVPHFFKLGRQDSQWHYFSLDSYLRHLDSVLEDQQWDSQLHWGVDGKLPPGPGRLMSVILDEAREEHLLNWLRGLGHTDLARWLAREAAAMKSGERPLRTDRDAEVFLAKIRAFLDLQSNGPKWRLLPSLSGYVCSLAKALDHEDWDRRLNPSVDWALPPGPERFMAVLLDDIDGGLTPWLRSLGHHHLAVWIARQASALKTRKDRPVANSRARRILDAMIAFDRDPHGRFLGLFERWRLTRAAKTRPPN